MTTTNMIALLLHQGDSLDLVSHAKQTGNYDLADFTPPTAYYDTVYGRANAWGQQVLNRQEKNLTWETPINLFGSNAAEVKRAERHLQDFLNRGGDENEPLYFAWRPFGDYEFEPIHGTFGKYARYVVTEGYVTLPGNYHTIMGTGARFVQASMRLTIKPMSQRRILSGQASGNLLEDIYKTANGQSRGVRINAARTNYITNPVFDHPTTWNTGWTAGGDLYQDENTDPRYYLFGRSSVRLVYDGAGTGGTADCYLISATPGSTNAMVISCFLKKMDGAAVESSDFFFVKGSTSIIGMGSGAPLEVGDGWWWCWVATTGTVGASDYGVRLSTSGRHLFMDGFQLEFGTVPTFLLYGDQVGGQWGGTPHASISATTGVGTLKYARKMLIPSYSEGTIRAVWKPDFTARYTSSGSLFYLCSDENLGLGYDGTNNRFFFTDGTNTAHSTSTILGNNTIYTLHATFDATNGIKLYINGAVVGTDATYTLPVYASAAEYMRVGANAAGNAMQGTFYGFATFDREMSAAHILADYNQLASQVADDMRVDDIPWTWTFDGGGVIYNQNDTNEGNYCITGGITGDVITPELFATMSADFGTIGMLHMGRIALDQRDYSQFIPGIEGDGRSLLFIDESGVVDAAASGGEHKSRTLSTSATNLGGFTTIYSRQNRYFAGKPIRILARVKDSGGGASANLRVATTSYFGNLSFTSEYRNLAALGTANFGLIDFGQVTFPDSPRLRSEGGQMDWIFAVPTIKRSTGSSAFLCDYLAYFPYPLQIRDLSTSTGVILALRGDYARVINGTWTTGMAEINLLDTLEFKGWPLEFEGGKLNLVNLAIGEINGSDTAAITWTLTINELWLTVRNQIG